MTQIHKADKVYFVLHEYFKSKLFSKGTKVKPEIAIKTFRTYECKVWPTLEIEKKLLVFEKKTKNDMWYSN